jgi:hypothetical protein
MEERLSGVRLNGHHCTGIPIIKHTKNEFVEKKKIKGPAEAGTLFVFKGKSLRIY